MSKKISLRLLLNFAVILVLAGSLVSPRVTAQKTAPAVTPDSAKNIAVVAATEGVLSETSEIRQLAVLYPVKSGAQSRAEIERMIIKNLDEETTEGEMHANEVALKKLGLVPNDFRFRPFIIGLLSEQVAGYYDPKSKRFYLADWISVEGQLPVMAHELTHALQDQHFNLGRFQKWPDGDSDAELAAHALVEGDATIVMMQYMMRKPERARDFLTSMNGSGPTANEKIDQAPRALRESLLFPYDQGLQFVSKLYARGGWKMVSEAFTDLPKSTEQILHADKYFAREAPVKVDMPDVSRLLGTGWKRIQYDINGEWSYYLVLDEFLKSSNESAKAAAGWGGDRYALYEGPNRESMLAQLTVWDTEQDANEFYANYVSRSRLRYQPAVPLEISASIKTPIRQTRIDTSEGRVLIAQSGARVLLLEGVPIGVDMKNLQRVILQSRR